MTSTRVRTYLDQQCFDAFYAKYNDNNNIILMRIKRYIYFSPCAALQHIINIACH